MSAKAIIQHVSITGTQFVTTQSAPTGVTASTVMSRSETNV